MHTPDAHAFALPLQAITAAATPAQATQATGAAAVGASQPSRVGL